MEVKLDTGQLFLHFQPVVNLESGLLGVEALVRLRHPQRGVLLPASFRKALDHPPMSRRIGCSVLDMALSQTALWRRQGCHLRMAINISACHLLDPQFRADLHQALDRHPDVPPESLILEITETAPMLDFEMARKILLTCEKLGMQISLDDFGTGNASLTWLQKLPAHILKIDQSFVRGILGDSRDHAIVSGIVTSARLLGLETVAEGVDTGDQIQRLRAIGCHSMQGYAIARPMPPDDIPAWVDFFEEQWLAEMNPLFSSRIAAS